MAQRLLMSRYEICQSNGRNRAEEVIMNLVNIDTSKCDRDDKEVIEGICLSYDMVKGICLETMEECVAVQEDD
jgi:hypothetical protein